MNSVEKVLVAVSLARPSHHTLRKAAVFASEHHASLTLLHVVTSPKWYTGQRRKHLMRLRSKLRAANEQLAVYAGEIASKHGIPVDFRSECGDLQEQVLTAAITADVLFVGAGPEAAPSLASSLAPSLACGTPFSERLLGVCPIPMMVVKRASGLQYKRALMHVDGAGLRPSSLRTATHLLPRAELTLFRAVDGREEQVMRMLDVPRWVITKNRLEVAASETRRLEQVMAEAGVARLPVVCELGYADTWHGVLAKQVELRVDVLVLVNLPLHTTLARIFLGNTARRLTAASTCDVLIVPAPQVPAGRSSAHLVARLPTPSWSTPALPGYTSPGVD